ncbi:MAG TPA: gliding motility-associated ABC transporter substrate-binding protein GldG [Chitinophagaceae bacterium]|nr:gliding motility-associated ABC transporter substrate-binding protein GldG [Chitinophagaceae bacterium]
MLWKYKWILALAAFLCINYFAFVIHLRFDLTKEKRYTISSTTKQMLHALDKKLEIDVLLKGDLPAGFQKLANSTGDFLQLLKENNSSKIVYRFVSADDKFNDTSSQTYADTLSGLGINPINLTVQVKQGQANKVLYPVALVKYEGGLAVVNLYSGNQRIISYNEINSAEALLEYQFVKAIDAFINNKKPLIAYGVGNGEPTGPETFSLVQTLDRDYELHTLDIQRQPFIPDTFKVLIITKPAQAFTEDEKLKIDQYVMRGGRLLCFIDNLHAEQDSLRYKAQVVAYDRGLNLTDLLFHYGVRINSDLVMDLQCDFLPQVVGGSAANPQYEFLHWNYFPLFESQNNHPINKNLGLVEGRFVNSIDTVKAPGITKTVLLSSSDNSRTIATPALISLSENRNTPEDVLFKRKNIPVATLLEGRFTSLYQNRVLKAQSDSLAAMHVPFLTHSGNDGKIIVAADGDLILNDFSPKQGPLPMGVNFYTMGTQYEYQFANTEFLQNCVEYLTDKQGIMETRNKDIILRLLDAKKVADQKTAWQFVNIVLPVVLIILFGVIYQWNRKRKFAV